MKCYIIFTEHSSIFHSVWIMAVFACHWGCRTFRVLRHFPHIRPKSRHLIPPTLVFALIIATILAKPRALQHFSAKTNQRIISESLHLQQLLCNAVCAIFCNRQQSLVVHVLNTHQVNRLVCVCRCARCLLYCSIHTFQRHLSRRLKWAMNGGCWSENHSMPLTWHAAYRSTVTTNDNTDCHITQRNACFVGWRAELVTVQSTRRIMLQLSNWKLALMSYHHTYIYIHMQFTYTGPTHMRSRCTQLSTCLSLACNTNGNAAYRVRKKTPLGIFHSRWLSENVHKLIFAIFCSVIKR